MRARASLLACAALALLGACGPPDRAGLPPLAAVDLPPAPQLIATERFRAARETAGPGAEQLAARTEALAARAAALRARAAQAGPVLDPGMRARLDAARAEP